MKDISLDELALFVRMSQYHSLTEAAVKLNIPLATLSRKLKSLETRLNCRLVERSPHQFVLTKTGETYLDACQPFIQGLSNATKRLGEVEKQPQGRIRVTAPINMTQAWLKACLFSFAVKYPEITLDLQLQNEKIDLVDAQVDIAFRVGDERAPDWVSRQLWTSHYGLVTHQSYLDQFGDIRHPSELSAHKLVSVSSLTHWAMENQKTGEAFSIQGPYRFESNDVLLVRDAVHQGMGISWMPPYYFNNRQHQKSGLLWLLPDWLGCSRPIKLLYRDRDLLPTRIQLFVQHVLDWKTGQSAPYASI